MKTKKLKFLVFLLFAGVISISSNLSYGQTYVIGSDTIHKIGSEYYYLYLNDSTRADTTVVTISFSDTVSQASRLNFESLHSLTYIAEVAKGNRQYIMPQGVNYVNKCNAILSDNHVDKLIKHFFFKPAFEPGSFSPNDEYLEDQWYLNTIKVRGNETDYGAWDITTGSEKVVVAVIDYGLEWDLEEFGPVDDNIDVIHLNMLDTWSDWDDPEGGDGINNDGNSSGEGVYVIEYTDDYKGWDFNNIEQNYGNVYTEDNDVRRFSESWHGTVVTSVISAKTNNEEGISGIAGGSVDSLHPGVKIMPLKVADKEYDYMNDKWIDNFSSAKVQRAVMYAIEQGANIINMSFTSIRTPTISLDDEFEEAHLNDVLLVSSAGNSNYSDRISIPGRMEYVIAVGATDDDDDRWVIDAWNGSNRGPQLDLVAPGVDIITIDNDGYWKSVSGTSLSSPIVAATAALMMSVNPDLKEDPDLVEQILKETAVKINTVPYVDGWNKVFGYGRINAYEAVCEAANLMSDLIVDEDETWNYNRVSKEDIIIKSGTKLVINSNLFMGKDSKIIVEPGAELVLNGAHISYIPFCDFEEDKWAGIEVRGTGDGHQYTINGVNSQGKLAIKNNTIIENATCAVRLYDISDPSKSGGIVFAENSTFLNNGIALAIFPYKNVYQSEEYNYRSSFENCSFIEDDNAISENSGGNRMMAILYGVKGISFKGCTFTNNRSNYEFEYALFTYDAGFKIRGYCTNSQTLPCPSAYFQRTLFNNFNKAIYCTSSANIQYSIDIRESDFNNNGYGIFMRSITDAIIVQNNFVLGSNDECSVSSSTGIFMDNCKRFAVEENEFDVATNPPATINAGINIVNTANNFDEVYNNTFDDLLMANAAQGKNWGIDENYGLAYYCNSNRGNQWDFLVNEDPNYDDNGIQKLQGSRDYTTGNTFSSIAYSHFENYGDYRLDYFYNPNQQNEIPDNNKLYGVEAYPITITNTCPSHYGDGTTRLSAAELQQKQSDYTQAVSNYTSSKTLYDSLGSSIDSATKQLLEEQMSYYNMLLSRSAYDIIRSEQADTMVHSSSINTWLSNLDNIASAQSRIELLLQKEKFTLALELLDSVPDLYNFSSYDSVEFPYYATLKAMQAGWLSDRRNIFELNTGEINQLVSIASNSKGTAGAQAKGILEFIDNGTYSYIDCLTIPDTTAKSKLYEVNKINVSESIFVSVRPNPASTQINIDYQCPGNVNHGLIQIWNAQGQLIHSQVIGQAKGTTIINVEDWQKGLYIYSIIFSDQDSTGKFMINR